jgi:hypothetical protein
LKSNKAAGEDGVFPELLKFARPSCVQQLHRIIVEVWRSERTPRQWRDCLILPLYKNKGDPSVTSNHRGIALLALAGKVYTAILHDRISSTYERNCRENQAGFRSGRGCAEQIFVARQVVERRYAYNRRTILTFVDFKAAFDSVHRASLWKVLQSNGIPNKIISLISDLYRDGRCAVKLPFGVSMPFTVKTGVRQGCILSPLLFNMSIDWVMRQVVRPGDGVAISDNLNLADTDYADDIMLISNSPVEAQDLLNRLETAAGKMGLRINAAKTKVMEIAPQDPDGTQWDIRLGTEVVEQVDHFKYLGSTITACGKSISDINARIGRASGIFASLRKRLWSRAEVSQKTKLRVLDAAVMSVLLYGAESWPMLAQDLRRLEVFQNRVLREILGVRLTDRVRVMDLRDRAGAPSIEARLVKARLRLLGHVARMPQERLPRAVFLSTPPRDWRKRRGGQVKTWRKTIEDDLRRVHPQYTIQHALNDAQNRSMWRGLIRDVHAAPIAKGRSIVYQR